MKSVIVVGGSSGIGYSVCEKLKDEYRVTNMSRRKSDIVDNVCVDITRPSEVKAAFFALDSLYPFGPSIIDNLVYSAGFAIPQPIWNLDDDTLDQIIKTNLYGAIYCTREFLKWCRKDSKIIYIASTSGSRPQPTWSAYTASKAGLINFALTMSDELKDRGIKVYCIAPGRCATPLRRTLCPDEDQTKIMQPEDVAEVVYTLLNDRGSLDGQIIRVRRV